MRQFQNDPRTTCAVSGASDRDGAKAEDRRQIALRKGKGDKIDEDRYNSALFVIR